MTPLAARSPLVFGLLIGLCGSAVPAFGQDAAGSSPAVVVLHAVVLPSMSVRLAPADPSRPEWAGELAAHWNLGSGHSTSLMVARSMNLRSPFGSARPRIVPAKYRIGGSCSGWGRGLPATWCGPVRLLAEVGLATLGRQRLASQPLRLRLPGRSLEAGDSPGTLDIRVQAL